MTTVRILGGLLDVLDSPGGYLFIGLCLLAAGIACGLMELTAFAMGVIGVRMRNSATSNHERHNGKEPA